MTDEQERAAFAALILHKYPARNDAFKAAIEVHPDNTPRALYLSQTVRDDPAFLAELEAARGDASDEDLLPTKAELARELWNKLKNTPMFPDDYVKVAKLYADIRGFIEKPSEASKGGNVFVSGVMEVTNHGTDDEWEAKLKVQQSKLQTDAS